MLGAVLSALLYALVCASSVCAGCPSPCECSEAAQTVKCVSKDLREIPSGIPGYTRNLFILGNHITRIGPESFKGLENVTNLSLSNNRIVQLESHAFAALHSLRSLDLSGNQLALIHSEALFVATAPLRHLNLSRALYNHSALADLAVALRWGMLGDLRVLDLSANGLVLLPPAMFAPLSALERLLLANNSLVSLRAESLRGPERLAELDLSLNGFRTLRGEALRELERAGGPGGPGVWLAGNPFSCACGGGELAAWLNASHARVADGDRLLCADPPEMRNVTLRSLGGRGRGCHGDAEGAGPGAGEGAALALQTSYVLLGLVLGLVGVVFLLVLYLNRRGMKKWVTDMREACQDVLEGYHYRYEIDSDPRLRPVATSGDL